MDAPHIHIVSFDPQEDEKQAPGIDNFSTSTAGLVKSPSGCRARPHHRLFLSSVSTSAKSSAAKECIPNAIDIKSISSSSSSSSHKGKLPTVLEETESLSHTDTSSTWDTSTLTSTSSASSSFSSMASLSASSASAFFRRGGRSQHGAGNVKLRRPKHPGHRHVSFMSMVLWPLRKVRDGYMSCMMSLDGVGDLSGIAQGSTFATSSKYFPDLPLSRTDPKNHG